MSRCDRVCTCRPAGGRACYDRPGLRGRQAGADGGDAPGTRPREGAPSWDPAPGGRAESEAKAQAASSPLLSTDIGKDAGALVTMAFHADLDEAARLALGDMLDWLGAPTWHFASSILNACTGYRGGCPAEVVVV